jgi:hypothetical protein
MKKWLWILFIVIVIGTLAFFLTSSEEESCGQISNLDDREICFKTLAIKENNVSICSEIETQNRKESCILSLVIDKGNSPELCDQISSPTMQDQCLLSTIDNLESCSQINSQVDKEACISSTVKLKEDLGLCLELTNKVHKLNCVSNLANILRDISLCDNLGDTMIDDDRDNCRSRFANSFTNPEQCKDLISEEAYNKSLSDNCYLSIALNTKNISLCYEIIDNYQKNFNCLFPVAVENNDTQTCMIIEESSECIGRIAEKTKEPQVCLSIEDIDERDKCYTRIASKSKDESICNYVQDASTKKLCISYAN